MYVTGTLRALPALQVGDATLANVVTAKKELPDAAKRDLLLAQATRRPTHSLCSAARCSPHRDAPLVPAVRCPRFFQLAPPTPVRWEPVHTLKPHQEGLLTQAHATQPSSGSARGSG